MKGEGDCGHTTLFPSRLVGSTTPLKLLPPSFDLPQPKHQPISGLFDVPHIKGKPLMQYYLHLPHAIEHYLSFLAYVGMYTVCIGYGVVLYYYICMYERVRNCFLSGLVCFLKLN